MIPSSSAHRWTFYRLGGLDQVALQTGADLLNLEHLDQKLWVALSCPVKGLELDEKTLALIDTDGDGRIRVPELLAAIKWAAARLKDPGDLLNGSDALPLAAIDDQTPEGRTLLASARRILAHLEKKDAPALSVADTSNPAAIFAAVPLNGSGVISAAAAPDTETATLIADIIACVGVTPGPDGTSGLTAAAVETFFNELTAYLEWSEKGGDPSISILGDATPAAFDALQAVRAKIDDYFARCRLAAFDARALAALNRSETDYLAFAAQDMKLTSEEVSGFPLATIAPDKPLPLANNVNPAWSAALAHFQKTVIDAILGAGKSSLTEGEWLHLCARFAPYENWRAQKAGAMCEKLGPARARAIANSRSRETLATLFAKDKTLEPEFKAIGDVDRLVRYHRDLRTLLHNFVNFVDFYSRERHAIFQAGTLYLDSRSTELCVRVDAASPLAAMSKAYIAYCTCTRAGGQTMTIAAAFTQGDSDYLFVGRRGVFYDRKGRDWDAVITSIVDNPISVRQAFWSPYKKFLRMIEEHVAKRAAAAEAASSAKLSRAAEKTAHADKTDPSAPPKKVDVGTVAAIGVAITGAVSALTLILGYVLGMRAWQYPLLFLGLIAVISGPSMLIAWLKLRQRTLGPILEASGWAVNGRVRINIPFGAALTDVAQLPRGAKRSFNDPYEDKQATRRKRQTALLLIFLLLAAGALAIRWDHDRRGHYFWEPAPTIAPADAETPSPAAAPAP